MVGLITEYILLLQSSEEVDRVTCESVNSPTLGGASLSYDFIKTI